MSFETAAASDDKYDGVPVLLRDALREPSYVRGEFQIYNNMDVDPLIESTPADNKPSSRVNMLELYAIIARTPLPFARQRFNFVEQISSRVQRQPEAKLLFLVASNRFERLLMQSPI